MKIPLKYKQLYVKLVHTLTQNYMPRALIFAIDVFLVFVAAFITCVLISSIQNRSFDFFLYSTQFSVIVIVQTLCMAVLKSYSGIVRYSSLRDAAKQLQVVLLCMIILLIANQGYYLFSGQRFILNQTIIVYGIIAFPHLFLFRVFVKSSYEIIRRDNPTARALILGVSHEDVAMASGLVSQKTSDFSIVGFLDTKNKTKKNNIFGLSVYKLQDLSHIRKP